MVNDESSIEKEKVGHGTIYHLNYSKADLEQFSKEELITILANQDKTFQFIAEKNLTLLAEINYLKRSQYLPRKEVIKTIFEIKPRPERPHTPLAIEESIGTPILIEYGRRGQIRQYGVRIPARIGRALNLQRGDRMIFTITKNDKGEHTLIGELE